MLEGNGREIVLVVIDDDEEQIELALRSFNEQHLANRVEVVRDGRLARQLLLRDFSRPSLVADPPKLLLLALDIPGAGRDLLRELRADARGRSIPVAVIAASREDRMTIDSEGLSVQAFIERPALFADLVPLVRQAGLYWRIARRPSDRRVDDDRASLADGGR